MKSIELKRGGFAEIYGAEGLKFGLLDSKGEVYNGTTCCKDFFTDVYWAEHHKRPTSIHGFKCEPGRMDLHAKTYQIALHREKSKLSERAPLLERFLQAFDVAFGIKPLTEVEPINKGEDLLITFSNRWAARPVMISLLTGMMRVGLASTEKDESVEDVLLRVVKIGNPFGHYDQSEFSKKGVIPLILKSLEEKKEPHPEQTYLQYSAANAAHHGGGFIAYTTGQWTS